MFTPPKKSATIDVESTGLEFDRHFPIQIAVERMIDGIMDSKNWLIKPPIPISEFITNLTGITNEMVANCPTFRDVSEEVLEFCDGCVLITFNGNQFDIPFLNQKFSEIGKVFPYPGQQHIDVMRLYAKAFPRDLKSVYESLTNYPMSDLGAAHDASVDTKATLASFLMLAGRYGDKIGTTIEDWIKNSKKEGQIDWAGKLYTNAKGEACYAFGKSKDVAVLADTGFAEWMLRQTWVTDDTKNHLLRILHAPDDNQEHPDDFPF